MPRERLANRRQNEIIDYLHQGRAYTAVISRYPDGRLAEFFLYNGKVGSDAAVNSRDASVVASMLLQYGCTTDEVRRGLSRTERGEAESAVGALLDLLDGAAANDNG
jgi:hypothetical protein